MIRGWRKLLGWSALALLFALTSLSFVLWGTNGPSYLVDLIAAYCL